MIIDAHQHFWKYHPARYDWISDDMSVIRRDFLPEELATVYKQNGIDGCVAVQVNQERGENDFFLSLTKDHPFVRGIVGWVDLRSADVQKDLDHYSQEKKVKGFRHIVQAESDEQFLLRADFCRGVAMLHPYGFTYDILVRDHQLPQVVPFVKKFPNQPFIIDHLAKPAIRDGSIASWQKHMRQVAAHENVYCKVSGLVTEADWTSWTYRDMEPYLNEAINMFGPSRLVYGSDWPVCLVAATYERQLEVITTFISSLSPSEQKKILGENAIRFYHI